ncbi:MAG TPA: ferritin-like domain-containing protein [Candidatus Absconditabacterales bacterium]|nr:ferritin-like domain-containing protein [Candidatus Absconditabacterales bacterium]
MVDKKTFIEKLNKALEWEYASSIQYVQHAALITGPEYDAIAEELVVHAEEELAHAIKVADIIGDLGATPSVEVEKRETSEDSKEMLEQDLKGEEIAINLYKELIAMAEELGEYGKRRILEDILMDEEEHKRDLLGSLGK